MGYTLQDIMDEMQDRSSRLPLLDWGVVEQVYADEYVVDVRTQQSGKIFPKIPFAGQGADPSTGAWAGAMPTVGAYCIVALVPSPHRSSVQPVILAFFMPASDALYKAEEPAENYIDRVKAMFTANVLLRKQGSAFRQLRERIKPGTWIAMSTSGSKIVLRNSGDIQMLANDLCQFIMQPKENRFFGAVQRFLIHFNGGYVQGETEDEKVDFQFVLGKKPAYSDACYLDAKVGTAPNLIGITIKNDAGAVVLTLDISSEGKIDLFTKEEINMHAEKDITVITSGGSKIKLNP